MSTPIITARSPEMLEAAKWLGHLWIKCWICVCSSEKPCFNLFYHTIPGMNKINWYGMLYKKVQINKTKKQKNLFKTEIPEL